MLCMPRVRTPTWPATIHPLQVARRNHKHKPHSPTLPPIFLSPHFSCELLLGSLLPTRSGRFGCHQFTKNGKVHVAFLTPPCSREHQCNRVDVATLFPPPTNLIWQGLHSHFNSTPLCKTPDFWSHLDSSSTLGTPIWQGLRRHFDSWNPRICEREGRF